MIGQGSPSVASGFRTFSAYCNGVLVLVLFCALTPGIDQAGSISSLSAAQIQSKVDQRPVATQGFRSNPVQPDPSAAQIATTSSLAETGPSNDKVRLRIYWGGGNPQQWTGSIRLTEGEFANPQVLGISFDAAASAIAKRDQVLINHWAATNFGGIDLDVPYHEGSQLVFSFSNQTASDQAPVEATVPLSELLQGVFRKDLDGAGNRVMVFRVPGDRLPVQIQRPHLIFEPGESFEFGLRIRRSDWILQKANCRVRVQRSESATPSLIGSAKSTGGLHMLQANAQSMQIKTIPFETDKNGSAEQQLVQFTVPQDPGVYDISLELSSPWQGASLKSRTSVRRELQIVVLDSSASLAEHTGTEPWKKTVSIDLTSESGSLLPKTFKPSSSGMLGNELQRKVNVDGRQLLELEVGGWKAVPLTFSQLGKPHLIEVEYIADRPTALGFSLLEPDANGQIGLYGFDSGLHIPSSLIDVSLDRLPGADSGLPAGNPNRRILRRHQFVVWPNEKQSHLLIANRDNHHTAAVGTVDVFAGPARLSRQDVHASQSTPSSSRRQFMVFSEEGLFAKNLGGAERRDENGNLYDDWSTFYAGADRLVQHLKSNGYTGAVITVAAEGSTLYPSLVLGNSPRLDSGMLSSLGQDPLRKDVLELLFRMFEREGLTLVPAVIFNGPLPAIESAYPTQVEGNQSVRPVHWTKTKTKPSAEHFPIYNPLNPAVQSEVNAAVAELAARYRRFQCFGGVAIICRPNTYTILPGQQWCWDTETLNRFWSDSQGDANLLGHREQMLEQIIAAQQDPCLRWRAKRMTDWYQTMAQTLQQQRAGATLFLAAIDMYLNEELATVLAPNLHATPDYGQQMLRLGWDAAQLAGLEHVSLIKPQRLAPNQSLASNRLDLSLENQLQSDNFFRTANAIGDLFVHRISWAHFAQLQSMAPFKSHHNALMRLQPLTPASVWNRQRFLKSLRASDAQFLIDGGALLSLGQEAELREFRALFSQLPARPFADVNPLDPIKPNPNYAPVIVRQYSSAEGLWFYAVNPSPWACKVRLKLSAAPQQPLLIRQLTDVEFKQVAGEGQIEFELPAISMTAGFIEQAGSIENYRFELLTNAADRLRKQVHSLQTKLLQSTRVQPLEVLSNSYFEVNGQPSLSGWELGQRGTRAISLIADEPLKGVTCLRLNNEDTSPVWIRSNAFAMPQTGRLSVSVWLRTSDSKQQPPLRISIEGLGSDSNYYRFGAIGSLSADAQTSQLNQQWQRFAVHFDDLPITRLSQVRIGLDLIGTGTVDADRFEVFDRWFDERDAKAINQRLASSSLLLANPLTFESSRILLDSYWLRFLDEHFQEQPVGQLATESTQSIGQLQPLDQKGAAKQLSDADDSDSAEDSRVESNERGLFRRLRRNNRLQR
jgi:hypothetical protein